MEVINNFLLKIPYYCHIAIRTAPFSVTAFLFRCTILNPVLITAVLPFDCPFKQNEGVLPHTVITEHSTIDEIHTLQTCVFN